MSRLKKAAERIQEAFKSEKERKAYFAKKKNSNVKLDSFGFDKNGQRWISTDKKVEAQRRKKLSDFIKLRQAVVNAPDLRGKKL